MIGSLPECAEGAVLGDADSGAAMVCDLATSIFLIGDIRDFVLHGTYYFTDSDDPNEEKKFNKPVFVFATLGILTTLAEATGVGAVLDAAVAGCKSAAKVLTGSKVMMHLADDIDEAVLSKPIKEMPGAAKRYLQIMQVVALAAFYGGDIKDFVVKSINDPKDLAVWIDYLKLFVARYDDTVASDDSHTKKWLGRFIEEAYAGVGDDIINKLLTKGVKEFIELLEEVNAYGVKLRGNQTDIGKAFAEAIKELKHLDEVGGSENIDEIVALLHKAPTVKAFLLLNHVGGETALKALRVFPCVPSRCAMESMEKFLESVANIGDLVDGGKITEAAFKRMDQVFKDLGYVNKSVKNPGEVNLDRARGAVGVISVLSRITQTKVIDDFEVGEEIFDAFGNKIASRYMDIKATDGTLFEVKGWKDRYLALERLIGNLDDEGGRVAGKISAQVFNDIVNPVVA